MMTGQNKKLWLTGSVVLVLMWMGVIFAFSAQPDTESSQVSGRVTYRIIRGWDQTFRLEMSPQEMEATAQQIETPVRKAAHMSEYAILAVLALQVLMVYFGWERGLEKMRRLCMWAFIAAALYAATDEFHQLFIPGRAGRITDVLIDSTGAAIGLFLMGSVLKHIDKRKQKRKNRKR